MDNNEKALELVYNEKVLVDFKDNMELLNISKEEFIEINKKAFECFNKENALVGLQLQQNFKLRCKSFQLKMHNSTNDTQPFGEEDELTPTLYKLESEELTPTLYKLELKEFPKIDDINLSMFDYIFKIILPQILKYNTIDINKETDLTKVSLPIAVDTKREAGEYLILSKNSKFKKLNLDKFNIITQDIQDDIGLMGYSSYNKNTIIDRYIIGSASSLIRPILVNGKVEFVSDISISNKKLINDNRIKVLKYNEK